jgi:hypothetical protein
MVETAELLKRFHEAKKNERERWSKKFSST